jgi:class 3 adenylate cyclase/CHASE2 domain-containing sensor protein
VTRPRIDRLGLVLLLAGAALWRAHDELAWLVATRLSGAGYAAPSLIGWGAAALFTAMGAFRLRAALAWAGGRVLAAVDGLEARLQKLPRGRARLWRMAFASVTLGGAVIVVVEQTDSGVYVETQAIDLFYRLRFPQRSLVEAATGQRLPSAARQGDVVVLAIDDETLSHVGWPMPRTLYPRLIDAVTAAHAKSLTFDVALVDASREHAEWDAAIGDAAARAGDVTFTFTVTRASKEARPVLSKSALEVLDAHSLPWSDAAAKLPDYSEIVGGEVAPLPVLDSIATKAHAVAMANVLLDGGDDVLRHALLVGRLDKRLLPSLSLLLAADALGVPLRDVHVFPGSHIDLGGKRQIPIDELGRTLVRYQGRHDVHGEGPFKYVSVWSLLRSDAAVTLNGNPLGEDQRFIVDEHTRVTLDGREVTLADVPDARLRQGAVVWGTARYSTDPGQLVELRLEGNAPAPAEPVFELVDEHTLTFHGTLGRVEVHRSDASALSGKHVLVGSTALAASDVRNSPVGELPGVEHHATMLANLLSGDFIRPSPGWAVGLSVMVAAVAAAAIAVSVSTELGLVLTALLMLALMAASYLLFLAGYSVPIVGPSLAAASTYFGCLLLSARAAHNARLRAEHDKDFVRQTFGRYLTEQVVQQLLDSPDGLQLGGQRGFVTLMMTDLRGFTSMCGSMEPEGVVKLLNHYLGDMTRIINRYGGTIDEFIGDAILVVFGAPLPLEHPEARAVACAIEMLNAMPQVNAWNAEHALPSVEMGIGIHSGEVVLGNIGSELRAKYGIVGATINLTSRVESFTVGGQVLVSEVTRERGGERLVVGASQTVSPKGVKGTLTIFEALAVGAPFDVKLEAALETLRPPRAPLKLCYAAVKNKQSGELTQTATVEAVSALGLELKLDEELPPLTDLKLRVVDGAGVLPGDLYGKITRTHVRPNVVYLRLTSVPPELKPLLEGAAS